MLMLGNAVKSLRRLDNIRKSSLPLHTACGWSGCFSKAASLRKKFRSKYRVPDYTEKIVWKDAPISTNEITERLVKTTSWSPKTIQTLIKRLVTKGALSYDQTMKTGPGLLPEKARKEPSSGRAVRTTSVYRAGEQLFPEPLLWRKHYLHVVCVY